MSRTELARWAKGERSFTALAVGAGLAVSPRTDVGVTAAQLRPFLEEGRSDVHVAVRVAGVAHDQKVLERLAKDRRVAVRVAVCKNPAIQLSMLDTMAVKDKHWDVRKAASTAIRQRVFALGPDEAVALVAEATGVELVEQVLQHPRLGDAHVAALWDRRANLVTTYGVREFHFASKLAQRSDLERLSVETLYGLFERGAEDALSSLWKCKPAKAAAFWERCVEEQRVTPQVLVYVASVPGMPAQVYEELLVRITELRHRGALKRLAGNRSADWELFADLPVTIETVAAVGKALAECFTDDPAVWLLAEQLLTAGTTVRELLLVIEQTHPGSRLDDREPA